MGIEGAAALSVRGGVVVSQVRSFLLHAPAGWDGSQQGKPLLCARGLATRLKDSVHAELGRSI